MSPIGMQADDLHKTYRIGRGKPPVEALRGVTFAADSGTVFALLGPNGAGKSTTAKILSTLAKPDSGRAEVAGIDVVARPDAVRRTIGFVAQQPVTEPMDTGRENLVLSGRIHGMSSRQARARADELLTMFGLADAADRLVKTYSGGMARKLDVALGIMHRPRVLFLDEPTTGLDPDARAQMWAEIERLAAGEGMTILLTTHYLDEADRLADRIAIVDGGRIVTEGSADELKNQLRGDTVIVDILGSAQQAAGLLATSELLEVEVCGSTIRARADRGGEVLPKLLAELDSRGVAVASATVARPSLDDVYLRHTGRSLVAAGAEGGVK